MPVRVRVLRLIGIVLGGPGVALRRRCAGFDLDSNYRTSDLAPQVGTRPIDVVNLDTMGLKDVGGEELPRAPNVRFVPRHIAAYCRCCSAELIT
jgi:hypothetical protein